ncbi:MAG TPA: acyl-CoA thioester hydrolase, partial [Alphaproteobacteria bacterium]|nr:acyl-CoA thioester hydrolase [Alphaproteobacteria bacterium]
RLEDEIVVQSSLTRLGGATIELRQDILRGEAMLTRAEVQLACIDRAGRPRRLPASVREALAGLLAERETAQERSD